MIGNSASYIEDFYNKEGHKYNISLEECKLICSSPFKLAKEVLNRGLLKNIRFQYLGTFEVMKRRVKYSLQSLENNFKENKISEKRYLERKKVLENYEENKSEKY